MEPFIVDVSSNQVHPIDWQEVKKAGCVGAILKASQGTDYINPYFEQDVKGCNANRIPVIAYHFAMFQSVKKELALFRRVAGARARCLDIETSTNLNWANTFLRALQAQEGFTEDQTALYGSESSFPRRGLISLSWVAAYHTIPDNSGVPNTALWQYTETGHVPGIENDVDVSKWTGKDAHFNSLFGITA